MLLDISCDGRRIIKALKQQTQAIEVFLWRNKGRGEEGTERAFHSKTASGYRIKKGTQKAGKDVFLLSTIWSLCQRPQTTIVLSSNLHFRIESISVDVAFDVPLAVFYSQSVLFVFFFLLNLNFCGGEG